MMFGKLFSLMMTICTGGAWTAFCWTRNRFKSKDGKPSFLSSVMIYVVGHTIFSMLFGTLSVWGLFKGLTYALAGILWLCGWHTAPPEEDKTAIQRLHDVTAAKADKIKDEFREELDKIKAEAKKKEDELKRQIEENNAVQRAREIARKAEADAAELRRKAAEETAELKRKAEAEAALAAAKAKEAASNATSHFMAEAAVSMLGYMASSSQTKTVTTFIVKRGGKYEYAAGVTDSTPLAKGSTVPVKCPSCGLIRLFTGSGGKRPGYECPECKRKISTPVAELHFATTDQYGYEFQLRNIKR